MDNLLKGLEMSNLDVLEKNHINNSVSKLHYALGYIDGLSPKCIENINASIEKGTKIESLTNKYGIPTNVAQIMVIQYMYSHGKTPFEIVQTLKSIDYTTIHLITSLSIEKSNRSLDDDAR